MFVNRKHIVNALKRRENRKMSRALSHLVMRWWILRVESSIDLDDISNKCISLVIISCFADVFSI